MNVRRHVDAADFDQSLRSLTDVGAWCDSSRNLVVAGGDTRPVNVAEMSVSGFRVADGEPLMGRVLVEADEHPAAPAVAVIGTTCGARGLAAIHTCSDVPCSSLVLGSVAAIVGVTAADVALRPWAVRTALGAGEPGRSGGTR